MSRVLVFSRDPAPTNFLIALIERLQTAAGPNETTGLFSLRQRLGSETSKFVVVTRPSSEHLWTAAGYKPELWHGTDEAGAIKLIQSSEVDFVLTGTSDSDEYGGQLLWSACSKLGIESHVVLDHPAGLDLRFRAESGERIFPDWIYVPDEMFRKRAIEEGLSAEKVRVLGDLNLERLRTRATRRTHEEVDALRKIWGVKPGDTVILFVSECMQEMKGLGLRSFKHDFDEIALAEGFFRTVADGEWPDGERIDPNVVSIVVRPHPRDNAGKYDAVISSHKEPPRVLVSSAGDADLAIAAADIIVGMTSSLLFEAKALKYRVHSLLDLDLSISKSQL